MKVSELIEKLSKERPEEEVVIIMDDNRSGYYNIEFRPLLHAGPATFIDKDGFQRVRSVVMIPVVKKDN